MARFKSWFAGLMAALLLFSAAPVFADEPAATDPGSTDLTDISVHDESHSYVRIKNKWKSNYLYEASDGNVLYGFTAPEDEAAYWLIEDGPDGSTKQIKNAKTGNYISIADTPMRRAPLTAKPAADSAAEQWYIENIGGGGFVLFKSATAPSSSNLVIHEEDQLGFAEASSDINVNFDSPQWVLEPTDTPPAVHPVRIVNYTAADAGADYLYEDENGAIRHGVIPADGGSSVLAATYYQWTIEDYDGHKRIRNNATGHYLTAGNPAQGTAGTSDASREDQWMFRESDQYDDYIAIQSASKPVDYLNIQEDDGRARSGAVDPASDSAQWMLEDPEAASPDYVRIQNVWQSFVLYEDENGDLKYGNQRTDQRDQWRIVKYEGRKLFVNRATGRYLSTPGTDGRLKLVPHSEDEAPATNLIWSAKSLGDGIKVIRNVTDPAPTGDQGRLINLQNLTKYAEYASINPNWGSPQWLFVPVPPDSPATVRFISASGQALYEAPTVNPDVGVVKYGDVPVTDRSSIWALTASPDGNYWVMNAATGHHLSLQNFAVDEAAAAASPAQATQEFYEVWGSAKWHIEGTADTPGVIKNTAWSQRVLQLDGNGNVKATYNEDDNAKFSVVPAAVTPPMPDGPIRIQNRSSQLYLFEQNGIARYGDLEESNGYSHWIVERDGSAVRIKNRATGHYLQVTPDYAYIIAADAPEEAQAAAWSLEAAPDGSHWLVRSLNGSFNDEYINVENGFGYAERGLYLTSFESVQWDFAAAPEAFETPNMDGGRNEITSTPVQDDTNYVRISSAYNGAAGYLTEIDGAAALAATDGGEASQWLAEDFNGRKLLKNRATGHLLAAGEGGELAVADPARKTDAAAQWSIADLLGYKTIRSEAADAAPALAMEAGAVRLDASADRDAALWAFDPVAADAKYEAEDAFQGGGAHTSESVKGYLGTGYVDGLNAGGAKVSFAVNAQSAGSYSLSLRYLNASGARSALDMYVNGLRAGTVMLPASTGWANLPLSADLRTGINTISLQAGGSARFAAAIDSLTVKDSVNKNYRGATMPYTTYEAEHGDTNGTILGPSRTYLDVASEASGRQAVKLDQTGQYVEFRTAKAANSIVLRFSIPDSANGTGTQATLGLYVNGEFRQKLQLNSNYAWEYGSYPWSNNPQDGSPHRFFDEMHALIGDVPAGATITLKMDEDSAAEYYIVDFAELEQADGPYAMPDGFVPVTDYGAVAGDGADDTAAFKEAMADAKVQGKGVWFPPGEFDLADGLIDLDQVTIRGAGMWHTQLNGAKFFGKGGGVQVYDLLIDVGINVRDDEAHTNAFEGAFGPGSALQNVWIEHAKAGLWLTAKDGAEMSDRITDGLYMVGLRIRNLMADGINFSVGTSNSLMEQSDVRYPGDDGIAMWSAEGRASVNNTVRFNTVSLPWLADNIVVFGGTDNKIQDNIALDTITKGAGIAVSTRFNPVSFAGTTVVERNTMIRTGSYSSDVGSDLGGLWIAAEEKDLTGPIVIRDNTAIDSKLQGLSITGAYTVEDVLLQDNVFDSAGTKGVEAAPTVRGGVTVDNLIIRNARIADVANGAPDAFEFREVNEGFANGPKPFAVEWSDGSTGRFSLKAGAKAQVKVKDSSGADVTDQADFATTEPAIASVSDSGTVTGLKVGETRLQVAYGDAAREYTLSVTANDSVPGGGKGGGSDGDAGGEAPASPAGPNAGDNDRKLMESKDSVIVFEIGPSSDREGEAPFTIGGLRSAAQANPTAAIELRSGELSWLVPMSLISKLIGTRDALDADLQWTFKLRQANGASAEQVRDKAGSLGMRLIGRPVEFTIARESEDGVEEVVNFGGSYAARTLTLDEELDPATATALLYNPVKGTFQFVPAVFETLGGKTVVTIKSALNGLFVVADHPAPAFVDVGSHWAADTIRMLASKTIVQGVSADTFAPNRPVTRAEFTVLLIRALGLRADGAARAYGDVSSFDWHAEAIAAASEYGLVQGMYDGAFRPGGEITREQMAVMVAAAYRLIAGETSSAAPAASFSDSGDIHAWAADAVQLAINSGLMRGQSEGAFAPLATATRAEAATVIRRLLEAGQFMN
ncbi:S-layer-like y domain-containing protein [Cohnella lubricantis]|uniref:S-layer homology domain-containing protein n=1 Tax=Cohnella lubricantis TaxID=2163172 RepID=A0A841TGQ8_9BACL|nr:S-layer homology domain-containing protein [Cohnella lubricantis]MBB6679119.1 S-layer homology domain-containing protein [Cohnella lubricantis]MBP2120188.1 hypothetical protein [Cohnella lubricantis]